ncbi:MAG: flippase-like domain-containing protein [Proteobacteria bacterium]|nr:flippase-like domain-containing protein [Pseudomonadota bacterium]
MRSRALAALLIGLSLALAVALWCGLADVAGALAQAGWLGLLAVSGFHLVPKALCAAAWWTVLPRGTSGLAGFFGFRWLRDAANDMLSVVPAAGELAAIRAMAVRGIPARLGAASTIIDLTVEMAAQCGFIALVLALLVVVQPDARVIVPAAVGLGVMAALLGGLVAAQRLGAFRLIDRMVTRLSRELGAALALQLDSLHGTIRQLYADRRRLGGAFALHLSAWVVGVGEGWIGLAMMGVPVGWLDIVMLETCAFTLRSAGFMLPGAIGIQEGGYVLLAPLVGIPADAALALSLLKRGREIVLGAPGCLAWQWLEGGRLWRPGGRYPLKPSL